MKYNVAFKWKLRIYMYQALNYNYCLNYYQTKHKIVKYNKKDRRVRLWLPINLMFMFKYYNLIMKEVK